MDETLESPISSVYSSSTNLELLDNRSQNTKTKYRSTCDVIPSLISQNLTRLAVANNSNKDTQISDLVATIRTVDQELTHLTFKKKFHKVMIVAKLYDLEPVISTFRLVDYLLKTTNTDVYIQDEILQFKKEFVCGPRVHLWSALNLTKSADYFDLVITLGGDGTILFANYLFQDRMPPILSFSMGSLGFLTQFDFQTHESVITQILENGYQCSIRTRFRCTVFRSNTSTKYELTSLDALESQLASELADESLSSHKDVFQFSIFNDLVIDRGPNSTMTSLDLFSGAELLTNIEADGVVIATPSGSTAYSLSAGGSLVHPDIPGILVSPICPHSLSFRPLIVPETMVLRIAVPYSSRSSAWCSFDGKNRFELHRGDFVEITTSEYPLPFIRNSASKNGWFNRLSDTLHWNERKRQKPFGTVQ